MFDVNIVIRIPICMRYISEIVLYLLIIESHTFVCNNLINSIL